MELLIFIIGLAVGLIIKTIISRVKSVGTLRVDASDPDSQPYLFLELKKDVQAISRKNYVSMKVNIRDYISHK